MRRSDRNWEVLPFLTHRTGTPKRDPETLVVLGVDPDRLLATCQQNHEWAVPIRGALIRDDDAGLFYEATVGQAHGRTWLRSLTILTTRMDQRIDQDTIRRVPVQRIAEQVALHMAAEDEAGGPILSGELHRHPQDFPTVEEVVSEWEHGGSRKAMAKRLNISVYTLDKRIREARDRGLIPAASTGRPRASKATAKPKADSRDQQGTGEIQ